MRITTLAGALAAPLLTFVMALPTHADSTCKDGTTSTATGRGACSGHGGVQKAAKTKAAATAAAPTASPAPAPAPAPAAAMPAGKTAAASSGKADAGKAEAGKAEAGNTDPTGATAKCKDGTYSKSKQHKGSCSHHGGVAEFLSQ